jgi:hypothetical protein
VSRHGIGSWSWVRVIVVTAIVAIFVGPIVTYAIRGNKIYSLDLSVYVPGSCAGPRARAYTGLRVSAMEQGSPLGTGTLGAPRQEAGRCHLTSSFGLRGTDAFPSTLSPPVCDGFRGEFGDMTGNASNGKAKLECDLK